MSEPESPLLRSHREVVLEMVARDPAFAVAMVEELLNENDKMAFALQRIIDEVAPTSIEAICREALA